MKHGTMMALGAALALASGTAKGADVELISEAPPRPNPVTAAGFSANATYSPDGKFILFSSSAADLILSPNITKASLFLLRTADSSLSLISVATSGLPGNGSSIGASISTDNTFVVFQSEADNLGGTDTNRSSDIFYRNLTTLETGLVSHRLGNVNAAANGASFAPEISRDGAWVVFETDATDLVATDPNAGRDIVAWNRANGNIHLVTADRFGSSTNGIYELAGITADSRSVVFAASGPKMKASGVTGGELYLHDLATGTNRVLGASVAALPGLQTATLSEPLLSGNGRYVFATATQATAPKPVLVRIDLTDDSSILVATNAATQPFAVSVSDDGQFAAFTRGTNVLRWSASGAIEVVDAGGAAGPRSSDSPEISRDGSKVAFISNAAELVPALTDGSWEVYIRDMASGEIRLVSKTPSGGASADLESAYFDFSPDGSALLFETGADDIAERDDNLDHDIFKFDTATGNIGVISSSRSVEPLRTARNSAFTGRPVASDDGRYVAFASRAQLSLSDTNTLLDAYVRDRQTRATTLVSVNTNGLAAGNVETVMISGDGRKVLYESTTRGQAGPDDTRTGRSIYLRDLAAGTTRNVSVGTGSLRLRDWSRDGRYAFVENETAKQLLRLDLQENTNIIITNSTIGGFATVIASADGNRVIYYPASSAYWQELPNGTPVRIPSGYYALSANGEIAAIATAATGNPGGALIITNFLTGANTVFAGTFRSPAMSADGSVVAFESLSGTGTNRQVSFYSAATGQTGLVSHAFGTMTASLAESRAPVVSASGRFIAYESWADDLAPDDGNAMKDVFVFDVATGKNQLASHRFGSGAAANAISVNPAFAGETDSVLFFSFASDFVDGDLNEAADLFIVAPAVEGVFRIVRVEIQGDGARRILWESAAGKRYIVQAKDRLEDDWTPVGEVASATGAESSVTDSAASSARYYRIVQQP